MNANRFHRILFAISFVFVTCSLQGESLQPQTEVPPGLKKAGPIVCSGHDDIVLRGRLIRTHGNGVEVRGQCDVQIVGSHIVAGGVAVLVQGHGDVTITDSYVEGRQASLSAFGYGKIHYRETTLRGSTKTAGRGRIVNDGGEVVYEGGGVSLGDVLGDVRRSLPDIGIRGGNIEVRDGNDTVRIGAGGVEVSDERDTVSMRSDSDGLHLDTGDVSLVLDADVSIEDGVLQLRVGGSAKISGDWRDSGHSSYRASDTDRLLHELGATRERGELHLTLGGDILFEVDSTTILSQGVSELRKLAHVLRERSAGEIRLVGHTDSLGSDDHNIKLSQARAGAVMRWLHREEGIPAQLMVGQGMGSAKPTAYNTMPDGSDHPEGRARNRRVEVYFAAER